MAKSISQIGHCEKQMFDYLGLIEIIEESENAMIILPNGTTLHLKVALFSRSKENLLSFKRCTPNLVLS